jgi:exodeoxyribonuclease V beta subunit
MSQLLNPLDFPLHGSRLIEASAGTGKTWTIAALYLRLVLGHGGEHGYARALLPSEILVMTFTRAATRELSNRVRERLVEAAAWFRGEHAGDDPYLAALAQAYPDQHQRNVAAHRLALAAETMDEAAIFTIDAWCQRMLREHAFDSGSLFDEELLSDESALFADAAHDYWRQHVYPLASAELEALFGCWKDVEALKGAVRDLVPRAAVIGDASGESLAAIVNRVTAARRAALARLKHGWVERAQQMEDWIAAQRERERGSLDGNLLKSNWLASWFGALREWAADPLLEVPALTEAGWKRLTRAGMLETVKDGFEVSVPECFDATAGLHAGLEALEQLAPALLRHAAAHIAARMAALKRRNGQFSFEDMLARFKAALEGPNGAALQRRVTDQFPVAMIDEFQDTSPDQYRIFDLLYRAGANDPAHALLLIGDPKQSIYGFRGADIHSYLAARRATAGRHYQLGTNFRSTEALVEAVNQVFSHAEGHGGRPGYAAGAFRFRKGELNPLPFDPVGARGRKEELLGVAGPYQALAVCCSERDDMAGDEHLEFFAHHCAEHIVTLLNDANVGFREGDKFRRLVPADIAVLVHDRHEAAAVRDALQRRKVPSVYLSDKDSVVESEEAADVLRWLHAVASPLDGALARAAFATATAALPLAELARLSSDEMAWEERVEQLKALHVAWQRQGVLAMLRRFIHELGLPSKLLAVAGGERRLTNLLHLAELLQAASAQLDGEQALIRWLAEQIAGVGEGSDERVLRLESDAERVQVVTVHKSKGLEYPLVYLPYAVRTPRANQDKRSFFEYVGADGARQLDLVPSSEALRAIDDARIEEDLRLLYVALTRASHFLWMGVGAKVRKGQSEAKRGENKLHLSALGYLLNGGEPIPPQELRAHFERMRGGVAAIDVRALQAADGCTTLERAEAPPPLGQAVVFAGSFERDWSVGSFTSLARHAVAAPVRAQDETLLEEAPSEPVASTEDAPWHRFPRGSVPGNFLHEQLEWMGQEGFAIVRGADFEERLGKRIERAGWANRQQDATDWLRVVASTPLPPLGAALLDVAAPLPEMEFWFPSEKLDVAALDQLCRERLLGDLPRPQLPRRKLHGMLKGFADLVFEHAGRYWVLDYKSNALGSGDAAYTRAAMNAGMAAHRYDIQGAIYMLALHRLLRSRLGSRYDAARQLGGAIFLFLRGIANPSTHGCCLLEPDLILLDGIDRLLANEPHTHEA